MDSDDKKREEKPTSTANKKATGSEKKKSTLSKEEVEVINKSIIEQLKAQAHNLDSIIIAGGAGAAGSSK